MRGGILAAASDGARILTGGDDGKVVATDANGESETLATDEKHRWIDHVALGPDGAIAWSAGKQAFVPHRQGRDEDRSMLPSTRRRARLRAERLAPRRRALQRRDAVVSQRAGKARHASPGRARISTSIFSPDGRFLVTAMQEPTLHGWRLADAKDMRMSGYSAQGALDGLDAGRQVARDLRLRAAHPVAVPAKDGPMGKQPRMLAPYEKRAVAVACHPAQEMVAVGFEDGLVMLVPHRGRRGDSGEEARRRGRSRRSAGAPTARSSRSARGRRGRDRRSGLARRLTAPARS